ncbi:NUB1 family protein [Megaselia abdita]
MSNLENFQIQVHSRLIEQSVKLWLEPFFTNNAPNIEEIKSLASRFSEDLKIPLESCQNALLDLQCNAIKKLEAKKVFEDTGIAYFALKVCRSQTPPQNNKSVHCQLDEFGSVLLDSICKELGLSDGSNLKIICAGKVLNTSDRTTLREQGITKFHNQLMVIISQNTSSSQQSSSETMYQRIERIKEDVETIVKNNHHNHFQMEDQDGNAIYLPPSENKAVIKALAFFEKGKAALKRQNYEEALVLLLEADEQFSTCQSKILESVDNYAYLNIDIVWCYLCLKNVSQAPDAKRRLELTEKTLKKTYGENMNRVMHLKGNAVNEKAIFVRLHLLQAILMFHENKRRDAFQKICQAESELRSLKVDETQLQSLMEMGYEMTESRIALRSCQNDVTSAIQFIIDRRNKRKSAREKSKQERASVRKAGGQAEMDKKWVNPRSVHSLVEMGFPENLSAAALRKSDNNVSIAVSFLSSYFFKNYIIFYVNLNIYNVWFLIFLKIPIEFKNKP